MLECLQQPPYHASHTLVYFKGLKGKNEQRNTHTHTRTHAHTHTYSQYNTSKARMQQTTTPVFFELIRKLQKMELFLPHNYSLIISLTYVPFSKPSEMHEFRLHNL